MKLNFIASSDCLPTKAHFLKKGTVFLVLLWLLVNLVLLWYFGMGTGSDTEVYIRLAHAWLEGDRPQGRLIWYSSYIALLAIVLGLGGSLWWVVAIQVLLSGVAALCLAKAVNKVTRDGLASFLAVFLYIAWVKTHQWNSLIYTESFFTSMAIISFAALVMSSRYWHFLVSALLIGITFFIRPTGFNFLLGWLVYGLVIVPVKVSYKRLIVTLVTVSVLVLLNHMLEDFALIDSYARGEIIFPDVSLGVVPPVDLKQPSLAYDPLVRLAMFVWNHPMYFFELCLIKLVLFFGHVKPYFSLLHNSLIILLLYPLYYLAVIGFRYFPSHKLKYFLFGFIMSQGMTVMLTTNDWDGRFLTPILPFIFILSAVGIAHITHKKNLFRLRKRFKYLG